MTEVPKSVSRYLAKIGRKGGLIGGRARSAAKTATSRANANVRRRYPPCPQGYKNKSHRFSSGRCACGYVRQSKELNP